MISAQISFSGKGLKQDAAFGLQHMQTKTWLSTNRQARFPNPIRNHAEVAGARNRQEWTMTEGMYLQPSGNADDGVKVAAGETVQVHHSEL